MQTNTNEYDKRASWRPPQQYQPYTGKFVPAQDGRLQYAVPQNLAQTRRPTGQKPQAPEKMPKARAMALANSFKRGFAIASIVGFATLSGLVAWHQVSSTTAQSTQSSSGSSSSNSSNSSSQNGNGFLNQQGGNTGGSSSSSSSSSSSTSSGTHTS